MWQYTCRDLFFKSTVNTGSHGTFHLAMHTRLRIKDERKRNSCSGGFLGGAGGFFGFQEIYFFQKKKRISEKGNILWYGIGGNYFQIMSDEPAYLHNIGDIYGKVPVMRNDVAC